MYSKHIYKYVYVNMWTNFLLVVKDIMAGFYIVAGCLFVLALKILYLLEHDTVIHSTLYPKYTQGTESYFKA